MVGHDPCKPRPLIRPIPQQGESWPGFLIRLAASNGILGIDGLGKFLGTTPTSLLSANPESLLTLLGVRWSPESEINVQDCEGPRSWYPHARVCSQCLLTDSVPFARAAWDNPMHLSCEVHGTLLIDQCDNCKTPLSHHRPLVDKCRCGRNFANSPSTQPPLWLSKMETVFSLSMERIWSRQTFATYDNKSRKAANALLLLLQRDLFHDITRQTRHVRNAFVRSEHLDRLAPWFDDWPNGFVENYSWIAHTCKENRDLRFSPRLLHAHLFPEFEKAIALCDVGRRSGSKL